MAPKPFPLIWGKRVSEGTLGYDVKSCRRKALEECVEIPISSLIDKWERYDHHSMGSKRYD